MNFFDISLVAMKVKQNTPKIKINRSRDIKILMLEP
jgi:hypothetical protein